MTCPSPTIIPNADITLQDDDKYRYGDIVSYQCRIGYIFRKRIRDVSIQCVGTGQWNDTIGQCEGNLI